MRRFKPILHRWFRSGKRQTEQRKSQMTPKQHDTLSGNLLSDVQMLQEIYADCSDVIFHHFSIGNQMEGILVYIEGMTYVEEVDQQVLVPLLKYEDPVQDLSNIRKQLPVTSIKTLTMIDEIVFEISGGNPVLLVEGQSEALALGLSKWEKRAIEEPTAESVLRGPREGFIESLRDNTMLIRRRIRNPNLKIRSMNLGTYTVTSIAVSYIEGVAAPSLVKEVLSRLERIDIDGIVGSNYIEEMIQDNPYSPFPQLLSTERPDVATSYLLEGYVVIIVDGSPNVLIAPTTLLSLLQSPEDYYERFFVGTAIRWLRYMFFAISLLGPSIYIAVITFHQEMIPTSLLLTMARSREQIPFPALVEALLMETMFEALREAGARLPKQIGTAVSIVGALVIGQAAISAGIVSAPMVMVVAITGVASFMVPRFVAGIVVRMLRFPMMFIAGFLGFLGLILGVIVILTHLLRLRSFGTPYLSPLAPLEPNELKDVLWRAPRWKMITRPHLTGQRNTYRQPYGQKPRIKKGKSNDE